MHRPSFSVLLLLFLATCLTASPSLAQYMYLDTNGDGVHTTSDVLNAVGTTQAEIWLRTNHNKDGSVSVCPTGENYTINSFTIAFRAISGTLSWTNAVSLMPSFGIVIPFESNAQECYFGYAGATVLPPGDYRLARVTLAATSGTPSLSIVREATSLRTYAKMTTFGSMCPGQDFDNTQKLGSDWFDVDGLAYSGGGSPNVGPVIPTIPDFTLSVGSVASRDLTVTDPDADVISCSLLSAPDFVHLTELLSVSGSTSIRLQARPQRDDEGTHGATMAASDGLNQTTQSFQVIVSPAENHAPAVIGPDQVTVTSSWVRMEPLTASDPDGDGIEFSKVSGPAFAEVRTAQRGHGGASGYLILRPSLCDFGRSEVIVGASDGNATVTMRIALNVVSSHPPAAIAPVPVDAFNVAVGDFNEDGHVDAVTVGSFRSNLVVLLGDGTGALAPLPPLLTDHRSVAVAVGDWNGDGHADFASAPLLEGALSVFYGTGNGTFSARTLIAGISSVANLIAGDLNRDGIDDLVAVGSGVHVVILLGHRSAGLEVASTFPAVCNDAAIGDFNLDGTVDLAITAYRPAPGCTVYFGRGDGTFGDPKATAAAPGFYPIVTGDWNGDGYLDLSGTQFTGTGTYSALGNGTGDFGFNFIGPAYSCFSMAPTDWDGDGDTDLIAADGETPTHLFIGRGDGSFAAGSLDALALQEIVVADMNEDGRPDLLAANGNLNVYLNSNPAFGGAPARAFVNDRKIIAVTSSSNNFTARLEPVDGSFTADAVNAASLRLTSEGTGSVSSITAVSPKSSVLGDTDRNGVAEFPATFAMADVARLFDTLHGKRDVTPHLQGTLRDGTPFCAPLAMSIVIGGGGGALAARVEPNPLNPNGVLRFSVGKSGPVTVRLFDLSGRLVRTIWDRRTAMEGEQEVTIDGRDAGGRTMATGVYFFRIEADGRATSGRFTVLK